MSNLEHWGHVDNKGRYASELAEEKEHPWYAHAPGNAILDISIRYMLVYQCHIFPQQKDHKIPNHTTVHLKNGLDRTTSNISFTPSTLFCSSLKLKFWSLEKIRVATSFWESPQVRAGCQSWARETTAERRLPLPIGLILYEEGYGRLMMDNFIWEKSW